MQCDGARRVTGAALTLTVVVLASRLFFIVFRYLDVDEFEHAHATWSVSRGLVPYRDFFEHHTPWLYQLFAPLVSHFAADSDPNAAIGLLITLRLFMWATSIASVVCVYAIGRLWRDRSVGVLAAFLVASTHQFGDIMFEFRPDQPALLCLLLCIIAVMSAWRSDRTAHAAVLFGLGGLAYGAALLFTQKMLFAAPGLAASLLAYVCEGGGPAGRWRLRAPLVAVFAVAVVAPIAWTAYWFAARDALGVFVSSNVDANLAQNAARFSPLPRLLSHLIHSPLFIVLGVGGLVAGAMEARSGAAGGRVVLVATALSLLVGVAVLPRIYDQYLIAYFPHLGVFAASWGAGLASRIGSRLGNRAWVRPTLVIAPLATLAALLIGVDRPTSVAGATMIVTFTLTVGLGAAAVMAWQRARPGTAAHLVLVALVLLQAGNQARVFRPSGPAFADIRYVTTHTRPTDIVLSAMSGPGVFRPHAWYYFFLGGPFASDREVAEFVEALESGRLRPPIAVLGNAERNLPPEVRAYVREHYRQAHGNVYERLPD